MDPWILLRLPLFMIGWWVKRFGWKSLLVGWGLSLPLIPILIHYGLA